MVRETRPPPRPRCPGRRGSPASTAHRRRRAHLQRGVAGGLQRGRGAAKLFLGRSFRPASRQRNGTEARRRAGGGNAPRPRHRRGLPHSARAGLHQGADRHPKPERRDARRQRPRHHVRAYRRRHGPAAAVRLQKPRALHGEPARRRPRCRCRRLSPPRHRPGVSARRGEAVPLLPCGKRPAHRLFRRRLLAPLHRGRARGSPRPGRAGHPALDPHLSHDSRYLRHRYPRRQQEDQPAPSGRSRR